MKEAFDLMSGLAETYEAMLEDSGPADIEEEKDEFVPEPELEEVYESYREVVETTDIEPEESNEDSPVHMVMMQAFFGPDKKYGACPICAAVVITPNSQTLTNCPNCHAELTLSMLQ